MTGVPFRNPLKTIIAGIGVFKVVEKANGLIIRFFVAPQSQYDTVPSLTTGVSGGTTVTTTLEGGGLASPLGGNGNLTLTSSTGRQQFSLGGVGNGGAFVFVTGDSPAALAPATPGKIALSAGGAVVTLTDDGTSKAVQLGNAGTKFGVGVTPVAISTITGSRSAATAAVLAQMLTALAASGLWVDSTTA